MLERSVERDGGNLIDNSERLACLDLPPSEEVLFKSVLRVDEAVLRTFQVFRHQPRVFLILAAVAWLPWSLVTLAVLLLIQLLFSKSLNDILETPLVFMATLWVFVFFPMSTCMAQAASVFATAEIYAGKTPVWKKCLLHGWSRWRPIAVYWGLLSPLCVLLIPFMMTLGSFAALNGGLPQRDTDYPFATFFPGVLVAAVCNILIFLYLVTVNPVIVLEKKTIVAAIRRSVELVGLEWIHVLGVLVLFSGIVGLLGCIPVSQFVVCFSLPSLVNMYVW